MERPESHSASGRQTACCAMLSQPSNMRTARSSWSSFAPSGAKGASVAAQASTFCTAAPIRISRSVSGGAGVRAAAGSAAGESGAVANHAATTPVTCRRSVRE
eukprot:10353251-Alexandrium_andersonii.AAC.1